MTLYEKLRNFSHFGAELTDSVKITLNTGNKLLSIFNQDSSNIIPGNVQAIVLALVWGGNIKDEDSKSVIEYRKGLVELYTTDPAYRKLVDESVTRTNSFNDLLLLVQNNLSEYFPNLR